MTLAPGCVAIVKPERDWLPAVVLSDRGKKLELALPGGRTRSLAPGRVGLALGALYDGALQPEPAGRWLAAWQARLLAAVAEVDLELLWQILHEEGAEPELDDLVALHCESADALQRAALFLALEHDSTFFKRRQERWRPRPAEEVEALQTAREKKRARDESRQAAVRLLVERQHQPLPPGALPEALSGLAADLRSLALGADGTPEARRALELLESAPHLPKSAEGAFRALVALGVFGPDEHLALQASGIPLRWRAPELEQAAAMAPPPPCAEQRDLRDLRALTIDEAGTLDPDDALSLEATARGHRLWIHITGVAPHIPPGSPLDEAAFARGATLYLPDGNRPMLPPACLERLALLAGAERLVLSAEFELSDEGEILEETFYPALIHVDRNWRYDEADREIASGGEPFATLARLADRLQARRCAEGALSFALPEVAVSLAGGEVSLRVLRADSPARQLVAELMILAGARWARFCRDQAIPVVYRRQEAPSAGLPPREQFADPYLYFFAIRKQLSAGRLSTKPAPHAGLGLPCYLQATSPLRRYQDLATQRQLHAVLAGQAPPYGEEEILRIAAAADSAAREIGRLERDRVEHWLMRWLEPRVGQRIGARVLGEVGPGRHQVLLDECLIEQTVRSDRPLEPGQAVQVELIGLNVFERQLHLRLAAQ